MIDHKNGEVWHVLDGETLYPKGIFPKVHCWKSGLHTLEHTIVGYLTSKQILGETFSLYFAFESIDEVKYQTVSPYIFRANIINKKAMSDSIGNEILINDGNVDRLNIKVTFDSLH